MTVITGARVVTPGGVLDHAEVHVVDGRIRDIVGNGARVAAHSDEVVDLSGYWLLPGFIDVHMHGGGGHDVTASVEAMAGAVAFHRAHGTTSTLVSLMAQPVDAMCEQLGWAATLTEAGEIVGAHLEGPFLSSARCGAQLPQNLINPDPLVLGKLLEAGQGAVRTVTVAPELPGALALIGDLRAAGVVAAVGHTDADYDTAMAAFDAGAGLATHLFNAMGKFSHRAPGPAVAALDAGAFVELINDGVHVHEALTRLVARSAPASLVLITDAISAAGAGDGQYTLGDQVVRVADGRAWSSRRRLAGSTLTMDEAVRRAVSEVGLPIELASAAASGVPARLLGLQDTTGTIRTGLEADFVVLDSELRLRRVMRRGNWVA
jgi:N-acetylglucosamine-6-phosphate deacetylase